MAIGVLSGIVFVLTTALLERLTIDDTMDSIAAHLVPGAFGLLTAAVAADENLLLKFFPTLNQTRGVYVWFLYVYYIALMLTLFFLRRDCSYVGGAFLTIACIAAWVGIICAVVLFLLRAADLLRLSDIEQERGLDAIADPLRERVRVNTHLMETTNVQGLTVSVHTSCARSLGDN
jgi:ammonia channel protein AmtB